MAQYYLEGEIENGVKLILSPMTERLWQAADHELTNSGGYFLYSIGTEMENEVTILAQVFSEEAVFSLGRLLKLI